MNCKGFPDPEVREYFKEGLRGILSILLRIPSLGEGSPAEHVL